MECKDGDYQTVIK